MKLDNLAIGKSAVIVSVGGTGALRQHFLDMGLIQGVEVTIEIINQEGFANLS